MNENKIKVSVVYLAWLPYGIGHFKEFIDSYNRHNGSYPHELIIAFNGLGHEHPEKPDLYIEYMQAMKVDAFQCLYFQSGQDIQIYLRVAAGLKTDFVLFLNTYSVINATNWLKYYVENQTIKIGLIGASGSYASYVRSVNMKVKRELLSSAPVGKKIGYFKYALKLNLFLRKKFGKFPNPHIRTNAFFISRKLLSELEVRMPENKHAAYFFENGINSLTKLVLKTGLNCVVIDKHGKSFSIENWPNSKTFWHNNQENLLIGDNQTLKYDKGNPDMKIQLCMEAWGGLNCTANQLINE